VKLTRPFPERRKAARSARRRGRDRTQRRNDAGGSARRSGRPTRRILPRALWLGPASVALLIALVAARPALALFESFGEWLRGPRFSLRSVEVIGLERLAAGELVASLAIPSGTPLLDIDSELVGEQTRAHPRIATASALRLPPDLLLLVVEERRPIAVLAADGSGIDAEGERLPLLDGEADGLPRARGDLAALLPLLRAAHDMDVRLVAAEADGAGDVRFQPEGLEVWVRVGREPERSLEDWLRLVGTGLVGGYAAREVDLRFRDSAVLRAVDKDSVSKDERGGKDAQER
jgi:hypothetical protein